MKKSFIFNLYLMIFMFAFLFSCAGINKVPSGSMQPHLQYRGFSVERPHNPAWYMNINEQGSAHALFRKNLSTRTHTFVAAVNLASIPLNPDSPEDLAALEKLVFHTVGDTSRFELLDLKQRIETRQNQWCIYYEEKIIDRKAPNSGGRPLIGRSWGFVCLHPSFPRTVVHAYYSERGLEDEFDPTLIDEGEDFLKGIQIESAPGKPVG